MNTRFAVLAVIALLVACDSASAQIIPPAPPQSAPGKEMTKEQAEALKAQKQATKRKPMEADKNPTAAERNTAENSKRFIEQQTRNNARASAVAAKKAAEARKADPRFQLASKLKTAHVTKAKITPAEHNFAVESGEKVKKLIDSNSLDPKIRATLPFDYLPKNPKETYTPKELEVMQRVVLLTPSKPGLRTNFAAITLPGAPAPLAPEEENEVKSARNNYDELNRLLAQRGAALDAGNSLRGRRTEAFNPLGFLEVVLILTGSKTCTGTMLNAQTILTAAHCVKDVPISNIEVMVPRFDPAKLEACRTAWKQEQRYVFCAELESARPFAVRPHPAYDAGTFSNDVALITLETPDYSRSTAVVEFRAKTPERVTLAGYGETLLPDKKDYRSRFALEVGWHSGATVQANNGMIEWITHKDDPQSSTCSGDSGGPIFAGDNNGIGDTPRPRVVFAVVSNASKPTCEDYTVRQTMLSSNTVKTWLCESLSSWIRGCELPLMLTGDPTPP